MSALRSLPRAVRALARNPILVVPMALFGLVQVPQFVVPPHQPILSALVSLGVTAVTVFVLPFVQGGAIAMASEAVEGRTTLGTFLEEGVANYVSLLAAYLAVFAVNVVLGIAMALVIFVGGVSYLTVGGRPNLVVLAIAALLGVVFVLAYAVVALLVQFYAHAIVLDDTGVIQGFRHSIGVVRGALVSVLGYSAIVFLGSLLFGGTVGVAAVILTGPNLAGVRVGSLSPTATIGLGVGYVLLVTLLTAVALSYSVAFYRSIAPGWSATDA
ncbi:MAG: hypothetical protein ABEJ77_00035 [Halanaeroarchaeum sp.]